MRKILVIFVLLFATSAYAEVLFYHNWDSNDTGSYPQAEFNADFDKGILSKKDSSYPLYVTAPTIVNEAGGAYSGNSMRVIIPSGESGGGSGHTWYGYITPGWDELYLSVRVKFGTGFDNAYPNEAYEGKFFPGLAGLKWPGGGGPIEDGFSARGSWKRKEADETPHLGTVYQYVYHPDQPGEYGHGLFWDDNGGQVDVDIGTWHHYEIRVKINDPANSYNGEIETWYDGVQKALKTDYRFRKTGETFNVDTLMWGVIASVCCDSSQDNYIFYDEFIISTHRVGPSGVGTQSVNLSTGTESLSTLDGGDKTITW